MPVTIPGENSIPAVVCETRCAVFRSWGDSGNAWRRGPLRRQRSTAEYPLQERGRPPEAAMLTAGAWTQVAYANGVNRLKTAETNGTHWGLTWTYDRCGKPGCPVVVLGRWTWTLE